MNTPTPRTNRFYASFADGECIPNQDEWLALCESLETELTAARQEIDMLKSKYADHHAEAERLTSEINAVTEQRDEALETVESLTTTAFDILAALGRAREERDRLAEALDRITISGCGILCRQIANEALQSLTTNAGVSNGDLEHQPDTHSTHYQP
jgi:septal ring factor EnvC (AmiA/AmiB activator)